MNIRLKNIIIKAIKGDTELRRELKEVLDISEPTLYRYLENNDDNLTKASAIQVIGKALALQDNEILEQYEPV